MNDKFPINELLYPFDSAYILQRKKALKRQLLEENDNWLEKKIAILSGSTVGEMKNILELFLLNQGIRPVFYEGQYNRFYEEVMFEMDGLVDFAPDMVYIHTSNKNIISYPEIAEPSNQIKMRIEETYGRFEQVWEKIRAVLHCPVIQNNFEMLSYRVLGNRDAYEESGAQCYIRRLNELFYQYAAEHTDFYINDLNYEASCFGLDAWADNSMWYMYKYPFALDAIPLVAHNISNIIKSVYGKNKKALALDLDNTLWGGVIGDDGVENIRLGIETPEGMAFSEFQKYIKNLAQMGILLNICSKNEEETAKGGFSHGSSELREEDFIIIKANWQNKDENIHALAYELNIGEDAIVFVDDNPVERGLVKENCKAAVPELGAPETYLKRLDRSGFFECTVLSEDDKKRSEYYRTNAVRQQAAETFTDYKKYLEELQMASHIDSFRVGNIQRVTQLINKTNQFNLTTKRYTQEEVEQYASRKDTITLCGDLIDKYGDNGIVTALMASADTEDSQVIQIDLWIMSCRVLKRDLEQAVFDELVFTCQNRGVKKIRGFYFKTRKNSLVENLYEQLGFCLKEKDDGHSVWEYDIPVTYEPINTVMEIIR